MARAWHLRGASRLWDKISSNPRAHRCGGVRSDAKTSRKCGSDHEDQIEDHRSSIWSVSLGGQILTGDFGLVVGGSILRRVATLAER